MNSGSIRVGAAQIVSGEDPNSNLEIVRKWTERAANQGVRVVVFPEAVQRQFGYNLTSIAEPITGTWAQEVRKIAETAGVVVVAGMFTPASPNDVGLERVRNTVLVVGVDSQGNRIHTSYDKIHLYDAFGFKESDSVAPGQTPVQFDVDGVRFGLATCYDVRFPQLFTTNAKAGAVATLLPASWGAGPGKIEQWRILTRARALDSTQYLVACGQGLPAAGRAAAQEGAPTGVGFSSVISPKGEVVTEANEAPELLIADLNVDTVTQARQDIPVLENSRNV